jgi:hypothetical protein
MRIRSKKIRIFEKTLYDAMAYKLFIMTFLLFHPIKVKWKRV